MHKEVILTGLRSNSGLHLGNYLGAILPTIQLQAKHAGNYQVNMFVPDLHSLTSSVDYRKLHDQTVDHLRMFVAAGLDINEPHTFIYRQSYVPAHSELTWILDCFTQYNELHRMTQFKEKSSLSDLQKEEIVESISEHLDRQGIWGQINQIDDLQEQKKLLDSATRPFLDEIRTIVRQKGEQASVGLLNYPVLMAADILLYGAQWIPVGEDQRQHLELTRNLAVRMNNRFGELFNIPHEWDKQMAFFKTEKGVRIRSLRNPSKKMSKSIDDPAGTILLTDDPDDAAKKVLSATTDSQGQIKYDYEFQPGISNLMQMLSLLKGQPHEVTRSQWEGKSNYTELKETVAVEVRNLLSDLQAKLSKTDKEELIRKLRDSEQKMNDVANKTLGKVQTAVGLRPSNT